VLRQEFFAIIRDLTLSGTTVLLSSHVLTELEARTDLTAILRDGRLAAFGDLDTLRRGADLPVKVCVKGDGPAIAAKLNGAFAKTVGSGGGSVEISCSADEKMALLRRLGDFGDLCRDLEIRLPGLDELYLHYSGRPLALSQETET
jgi:Cu-processing system ATP-binding protein